MKTGIKNFCIKYNTKLKNDKDIKENQLDFFCDYRDRISFRLNVISTSPNSYWLQPYPCENLITLDNEDLEYLYKKYSVKMKEEMEMNIAAIKNDYNFEVNGRVYE